MGLAQTQGPRGGSRSNTGVAVPCRPGVSHPAPTDCARAAHRARCTPRAPHRPCSVHARDRPRCTRASPAHRAHARAPLTTVRARARPSCQVAPAPRAGSWPRGAAGAPAAGSTHPRVHEGGRPATRRRGHGPIGGSWRGVLAKFQVQGPVGRLRGPRGGVFQSDADITCSQVCGVR